MENDFIEREWKTSQLIQSRARMSRRRSRRKTIGCIQVYIFYPLGIVALVLQWKQVKLDVCHSLTL